MLETTKYAMFNGTRPFCQTNSGRTFPLLCATPADVHWDDVVFALAHQNRYAGSAGTYSIAQHSVHVSHALPRRLRLAGLLHDAPEFAYGDMTKPCQEAFAAILGPAFKMARRRIDDGIAEAIHEAAGLPAKLPADDAVTIKVADTRVTMTEKRDLLAPMTCSDREWLLDGREPVEPLTTRIEPWSAETSARVFADELRQCGVRF